MKSFAWTKVAVPKLAAWRLVVAVLVTFTIFGPRQVYAQRASEARSMAQGDKKYVLGPDSLPQPGVPKGEVVEMEFNDSAVFPETQRKISVYVPAQYRGDRPACLYVALDGLGFEIPTVFDNLIAKKEMPVTIAIGIPHGEVDAPGSVNPRYNRSFEFDALSGDLARFVLNEIIPAVERLKTQDGRMIMLSRDPNDRGVGGASTGAIGAFTLAWERPDAFRRVFLSIGTFVGMRGGDRYPVLVRKTDPKPLRIFMQDGSDDHLDDRLGEVGNWWLANLNMESAFRFAGYDVAHVWGDGSHSLAHPFAVFPDGMRWLWREWPKPVLAQASNNVTLNEIGAIGEGWELLAAADHPGHALISVPGGEIGLLGQGGNATILAEAAPPRKLNFRRDARAWTAIIIGGFYVAEGGRVSRYDRLGRPISSFEGVRAEQLISTSEGMLYVTERVPGVAGGKLWQIDPDGRRRLVDSALQDPSGLSFSPDGQWLVVAESSTHWAFSYRVHKDGGLDARQRFYWFHVPDDAEGSGAGGLSVDLEGRLYAATRMGVQVFDRNGRSRAILPLPSGHPVDLAFGGADMRTLYALSNEGQLYRRHLKVSGHASFQPPVDLPAYAPS